MRDAPKVLIGCEESQVFQQEFERAGFNAWSCDLALAQTHAEDAVMRAVRHITA